MRIYYVPESHMSIDNNNAVDNDEDFLLLAPSVAGWGGDKKGWAGGVLNIRTRSRGEGTFLYIAAHFSIRTSFVFCWSGQVSSVLVTRWSLTDQNDDDHWRLKWLESIGQFRWNQSNRPEMLNEPNRGVHGKIQIYCRSGAIRREPRKQRNKDRKTVYFRFFLEAS